MKLRCIRPFRYAADHINNVPILAGEVVNLPDDIAASLLRDGFVEGYWPEEDEPRPQVKALGPAPENKRGRPRKDAA